MRRPAPALVLAVVAMCVGLGPAFAGVPSPPNCTFPPCLAACPLGDIAFDVIVRDLANNTLAGSTVVLDFSQCIGAFICSGLPTDPYTTDVPGRRVLRTTDANGKAHFPLRVGGTGSPGSVRLFASGLLLSSYALASPDQSGNGVCVSIVDPDDAIFAAKKGTTDPTADFDCDGGVVDAQDEFIFFYHHSHSCLGFVDPVRQESWGALKLHYR